MSTTTIPLKSEHLPPHLLSSSSTNNEKIQTGITPPPALTPNATNTDTTAAQAPNTKNTNTTNNDTRNDKRTPSLVAYLATLPEFTSIPRMQSLYSDLGRQKASNPTGYAANLGWWRAVLVEVVKRGLQPTGAGGAGGGSANSSALVLRVDQELSDALRVERVGRPAGLGTVVDDLAKEGVIHRLELFLSSNVSIYDGSSVVGRVADLLIKRSFWWALGQLNLVNVEANESEGMKWRRARGEWVVVKCVERLADTIIAAQDEKSSLTLSDSLYTAESFKRYAESCEVALNGRRSLSEMDVKVLIKYLARDRRVVVVQGDVIKFAEDDAAREITSVDRGVLELKTTIEKVEQQIEQIQMSMATRMIQIKAALLASRQEIAKIQLKSRNALQALLTQRLGTLSTLTTALASIDQAHGDAEILRAYEGSSRVLKEILSRGEMKEERVEAVMEELREQMEGAESVRRAVEEGGWEVVEAAGLGGKEEGEEELERELEELVKEEKRMKELKELKELKESGSGIGLDERVVDAMRRLGVTGATPKEEKVTQLA